MANRLYQTHTLPTKDVRGAKAHKLNYEPNRRVRNHCMGQWGQEAAGSKVAVHQTAPSGSGDCAAPGRGGNHCGSAVGTEGISK